MFMLGVFLAVKWFEAGSLGGYIVISFVMYTVLLIFLAYL